MYIFNYLLIDGGKITKWVYTEEGSGRPLIILPDEVIHFKDWNPWNVYRGVSPLVSLGLEVEQDLLAAKQNTGLLKEGGVPKGLLKTDQVLTEAEAELLATTWHGLKVCGLLLLRRLNREKRLARV